MYGLKRNLARLWKDESGVTSVEYALLLAFIAAGYFCSRHRAYSMLVNKRMLNRRFGMAGIWALPIIVLGAAALIKAAKDLGV